MQETSILESVVKRDRAIVIAGLLTVVVLSWIYILTGAGMGMTAFEMSSLSLPWQTSSDMAMPNQMGESQVTQRQAMGSMMEQAHMAMMKPAVWTAGYAFLMFMTDGSLIFPLTY